MSDYEWCEKHKLNFLMPEYAMCPYCFLEFTEKLFEQKSQHIYADMCSAILDDFKAIHKEIRELREKNESIRNS